MYEINQFKKAIEQLILSSLLYQDNCNELDKIEFEEHKINYLLFTSNKTIKQCAKAIFNLQEAKSPISEVTVFAYISKHLQIDTTEWLELICTLGVTYDTMIKYEKLLIAVNNEIELEERLREI